MGGLESHPVIFQLKILKPQSRGDFPWMVDALSMWHLHAHRESPGRKDAVSQNLFSRDGNSTRKTQMCVSNCVNTVKGSYGSNFWTKIEDGKGSKEETCAPGPSRQDGWFCISSSFQLLFPTRIHRSDARWPVSCAVVTALSPWWRSLGLSCHPGVLSLSEVEVQHRVSPLLDTFAFTPALAQHSGLRGTGNSRKGWARSWATQWVSVLLFP